MIGVLQANPTATASLSSEVESPSESAPMANHLSVFDFLLPIVAVAVAGVLGWGLWRWLRPSPTRSVKRAVQLARKTNEQYADRMPAHAAPEMEMRRREVQPETLDAFSAEIEPPQRRISLRERIAAVRTETDEGTDPILDVRDEAAIERLRRLRAEVDPKDARNDYRRLDGFVRRYLFETYGVKSFGESAASLLASLPQDLTEGVIDYAGEIIRVCELAESPRHRASRAELRHLHELAAEMVYNHARVDPNDATSHLRG